MALIFSGLCQQQSNHVMSPTHSPAFQTRADRQYKGQFCGTPPSQYRRAASHSSTVATGNLFAVAIHTFPVDPPF